MLKIGDKITVRYSKKLAQKYKGFLINRVGEVQKLNYSNGELTGVYVTVMIANKPKKYYIPKDSIECCDEINRLRVLGILKSTIL